MIFFGNWQCNENSKNTLHHGMCYIISRGMVREYESNAG